MTTQTRLSCKVYEPGLQQGMEINVTNALLGLSGQTWTITKMTVTFQPKTLEPVFNLDLGLGVFAAASTGATDGGPLDPETLPDLVEHVTYDSMQETTEPRSIGHALETYSTRYYMNMDPPDGLSPDLASIEISPVRSAYIVWADPGSVVIDHVSGGGIAVSQSGHAAWVSTNDGVISEFSIVAGGTLPDWILVMVGGMYGEVLGGTQTILP